MIENAETVAVVVRAAPGTDHPTSAFPRFVGYFPLGPGVAVVVFAQGWLGAADCFAPGLLRWRVGELYPAAVEVGDEDCGVAA
jgi:hypothetical protein